MSSTVELLISELDEAIAACVAQDRFSSESSDALEDLKFQITNRQKKVNFDNVQIRRTTAGLSLPPWMPKISVYDWT
jgi:hypothetical protein